MHLLLFVYTCIYIVVWDPITRRR